MTHLIRPLLVALIIAAVGFAPAPFPKKERAQSDDMAALLGTWEFTTWERHGTNDASSVKQYVIEITDGQYTFVTVPATPNSSRTPYTLVLRRNLFPRGFEWKSGNNVQYVGSYKLQGEVLTMIFKSGYNLADRPIDFNGKPEFRFVMRRIKSDDVNAPEAPVNRIPEPSPARRHPVRLAALLTCLVLTALVGFAPAPFPRLERRRVVDDMEAMIGIWRMTTYESNGSAIGNHYKIRIRKNAWTFINTQGQERESATYIYTLNPKLAPRAFEWKSTPTSTYGWIGSYRLEGRRLEIIFGSGLMAQIENRPKDFGGRPSYRMVLEYIGRE